MASILIRPSDKEGSENSFEWEDLTYGEAVHDPEVNQLFIKTQEGWVNFDPTETIVYNFPKEDDFWGHKVRVTEVLYK